MIDEPRSFTVNRLLVPGMVMLLLGLSLALNAREKDDQDEAFTLMWDGCCLVFSALLVAAPSLEAKFQRRGIPRGKR